MKHFCIKRIIASVLALVIAASALPLTLAADTTGESSRDLLLLDPDKWECSDGDVSLSKRTAGGNNILYIAAGISDGRHSFTLTCSPEESLNLSDFREITAEVSVISDETCVLTLAVVSDGDLYSSTEELGAKSNGKLCAKLPASGKADEIRLSISSASGEALRLTVVSLTADSLFTYSYKNVFMADDVTLVSGTAVKTEKTIEIPPSPDKTVLGFSFNCNSADTVSAVYIDVSGAASGSISAEAVMTAYNADNPERNPDEPSSYAVEISPAQALYPGSNTYCFIVYGEFSEISFTLEGFSADQSSTSGNISVSGAGVTAADSAESESFPGAVTSAKPSADGSVRVSGTLTPDAAVEYINATLGLYVIPVWEDETEALRAEPDKTANLSTKFEFSVTPKIKYTNCKYLVAIITDDEAIPVDNAVFADCGAVAATQRTSVSALHGADAAGVFESDVSTVVIDVCAGELLETEDIYSAHLYSYSGNYYYFNNDYLSAIDKKISFCTASGNNVMLRLLSGSAEDPAAFDYSPYDSGSVALMCAVTEYLAKKYQGCSGFIMGSPLNDGGNIAADAEKCAALSASFTETVKSNCPGALSVIPIGDNTGENPAVFSAMLAYYMNKHAMGTAALMYQTSRDPNGGVYAATHIDNSFGTFGVHTADGCLEMWEVPGGLSDAAVTDTYRAFCKTASASGLISAVLSVAGSDCTPDLFDEVKRMLDEEDIFTASITQKTAESLAQTFAGKYMLWDFTSSYDTSGWLSGGTFGDCITSPSSSGETRVLKTQPTSSVAKSGVCVGWLENPVDASESTVELDLSLISDTAAFSDIAVIIGSGDLRCEFSSSVEHNVPTTLFCDLSGFAGSANVEYAAVIVRSDSAVSLEISSIGVCSKTMTDDQLREMYTASAKKARRDPALYILLGFIAAATLTVCALLGRRKPKK